MFKIKKSLFFSNKLSSDTVASDLSVFQTYRIQKQLFRNILFYALPKKMLPKIYYIYNEDDIAFIFPAMEDKNIIELAGSNNGISNLSPIYFEKSKDIFIDSFEWFINSIDDKQIMIERILENSRTHLAIEQIENNGNYTVNKEYIKNVKIPINKTYDEWFAGLKKSVRQNLRTALNRMNKDSKLCEIKFFSGNNLPKSLMKNLVEIYNNRHADHYGVKTTALKRFYMHHIDYSTRDLKNNKDARHCVLYIDGEVAAFYSGYFDNNSKSIIIPRLSINPNYYRYSPGYILINEAVKEYVNDENVEFLDLSTGTEKYKLDLGGEMYNKINFIIKKDR